MTPLEKFLKRGILAQQRKAVTLSSIGQTLDSGNAFSRGLGAGLWSSTSFGGKETIGEDFEEVVRDAYQTNGIVFACILVRMLSFSEPRFAYQTMTNGRPGDLSDGTGLSVLHKPWVNGTTGELLARMEQDSSLCGNFFAALIEDKDGKRLRRLRPDWMTIVSGVKGEPGSSPHSLYSQPIGYVYKVPGLPGEILSPESVVHYSPIPDPVSHWRGMSWLSAVLPEVEGDQAATAHKRSFFKNGALSTLAISYDASISPETIQDYAALFSAAHTGSDNTYKTLHMGGGADPRPLNADLKSIDFKAVQGAGETRIAAAAGVGAIIARLSEGLAGSSLNQGNFAAAKRQFGDMTLRPLWRIAAGSFEKVANVPEGSRLWMDTRDVPFLREDETAAAEILAKQMTTIKAAVDSGFDPDSAIDAIAAGDLRLLKGTHSGRFSVQLHAPDTTTGATP
jgi:hypothetical protein